MDRRKKLLISAALVLAVAAVIGAGSFATFNAQTGNPGNAFAAGTLVLSDTKQGGSACLSTGGGTTDTNVNTNCDTLYNLTVKKPGDSGTANVTLKNEGSLAGSLFKVFSNACTGGDASGETYHGTGNPCTKVQLYIQQFSDSGFSTPLACIYGGATGNTCSFSDTTKTLGDFQTTYGSAPSGLTIGSGLTAGASAYFQVGVKMPSGADNTFQGRKATVDFEWYLEV
jgi:hypothetical protein